MEVLMIRSSRKKVIVKTQIQISIIFIQASQYRSHSVLLSSAVHCPRWFCPWVRGGCIACSRVQGGLQCDEDVYPSNHAQRTVEILQLPFS